MSPARPVYLDHAATTPMLPAAIEAMTSVLTTVGNASSLHTSGRAARRRMEEAGAPAGDGTWKESLQPMARVEQAREAFWAAMADDLNTPEALAALFTLITELNAQDDRAALTREERDAALAFLDETDAIFAGWPHEESSLDAEVEALIEARRAAKAAKNWAESDRIRDELKAMGILLEDRKDGSVGWKRA